jgi:hypothetical protein
MARGKTTTKPCFSNGTEFMAWQDRNCCRCVKAVWFNEKKNDFPAYRCAVQGQIEGQAAGLYEVSERTYNATQQKDCPYIKTERTKPRKKSDGSPSLF